MCKGVKVRDVYNKFKTSDNMDNFKLRKDKFAYLNFVNHIDSSDFFHKYYFLTKKSFDEIIKCWKCV